MRAARLTAPRTFEFIDIDRPTPKDGEVLLKVEKLSVCGSDTHMFYDAQLPEEMYPARPGAPCHEIAGTVVESRLEGVRVGQRLIVLPDFMAEGSLGGLVEYIPAAAWQIIPLPDEGGLDEWLMCQPSGTVLFATKLWGNTVGQRIGVLGQGAIGLSFTMLAAAQGAEQVIGFDLLDYRLDKARELGATDTINPDSVNAHEALAELTHGHGLDVMVDASGDPEGLNQAIDLVKDQGKVLGFSLVGMNSVVPFRHMNWMRKRTTLIPCSSRGSADPTADIKEIVELRERGWVDPGRLITHQVSFDEIPEAYEMYSTQADGVIKVVMSIDS